MIRICFYLHAHQPLRLAPFSIFDIGKGKSYFDEKKNQEYLARIAKKSYLPTNKLFLNLIKKTKGKFRLSFSVTGILLDQLKEAAPEVIADFQKLARGGCDFLVETYYHSLASLFSEEEFKWQVEAQKRKIKKTFKIEPAIFRNTELIYSDRLAPIIKDLGYQSVIVEGADKVLKGKSPNFLYQAKGPALKLILKNYRLSDDIAFRFSKIDWQEHPLTADKFLFWIREKGKEGGSVNLFMDYETFGEHQWQETGIFEFLEDLIIKASGLSDVEFLTVRELASRDEPVGELEVPAILTWADTERDLSAWLGNNLQQSAAHELYGLEDLIKKSKRKTIIDDWRKLQVSDHFYYMCTKWFEDGDVHKYFNPYESPYDAYINYMNVLRDLKWRLGQIKLCH